MFGIIFLTIPPRCLIFSYLIFQYSIFNVQPFHFHETCCHLWQPVETERFELLTPCLQGRCSPNWATPPFRVFILFMGLSGLEPPTSRLSGVRSNRLSYKPKSVLIFTQKLLESLLQSVDDNRLRFPSIYMINRFPCFILFKSGSHLLSHIVSNIVPSAA